MDQFSMKIEIASTVLYINKHNFKAEDISKVSSFYCTSSEKQAIGYIRL